jgi:hypothetical protein
MHDATKVLLGSVGSSDREVTSENAAPAGFVAGVAVRRTSAGGLSLSSSDGQFLGVSLGVDLSDTSKTAVCRSGNLVPVKLKAQGVLASRKIGDITFTSKNYDANAVTITIVDDQSGDVAVVSVATKAITIRIDAGTTLTATLKAAVEAYPAAHALVTVAIDSGDEDEVIASAQTVVALQNGVVDEAGVAIIGGLVTFDNTTGEGASTGTASKAKYVSGVLNGVKMDGTTYKVALVDMGKGLK